jgi:hypothetical protein
VQGLTLRVPRHPPEVDEVPNDNGVIGQHLRVFDATAEPIKLCAIVEW